MAQRIVASVLASPRRCAACGVATDGPASAEEPPTQSPQFAGSPASPPRLIHSQTLKRHPLLARPATQSSPCSSTLRVPTRVPTYVDKFSSVRLSCNQTSYYYHTVYQSGWMGHVCPHVLHIGPPPGTHFRTQLSQATW